MVRGAVLAISLLATLFTVDVVRAALIPPGITLAGARCYSTLRCDSTAEIGFMTNVECCRSEPQGLAYNVPGIEECVPCVLYGWINAGSVQRVQEAGPGQTFQVGYLKTGTGTPPQIELTVEDVEGTARRGAAFDYSVTDNTVSITPDSRDSATVTIRVDGIALEEDETFQLRLVANSPPPGIFCLDTLDFIIEDGNEVNIQLTEDDYRGTEADGSVGIVVSKDARIASDVSLTVSPVVLSEARRLNRFPMNVLPPDDNEGRSPVDADLNDFNDTVLTITFLADETAPVNDIPLSIPITDDAINEANEQDFVVILNLTNSVNPALINLPRTSSLCRIIDNDPIMIGFEREINNFTEPRFDEDEFIYVAKENNIISEQTFRISFQRTDSVPQGSGFEIAQDGQDYRGIPVAFQRSFFPFQQRISIPFQLLADTAPEPTEAVQLSLSTQDSPAFDSADVLFTRTFLVIEDDDITVRIGFEETAYTVNEEDGTQEVCVRVFVPDDEEPLVAEISALIATRVGTADESDYTPVNPDFLDVVLMFNDANRRNCFNVSITNDILVEGPEQFSLELLEDPFFPPPIPTMFNASLATVTILDQDEAVIGFLETNYFASESSGLATVEFGLISGGVQSNVNVQLGFDEGTARDVVDFDSTGAVFTFNSSSETMYSFNVSLVNDNVYEFIENFNAQLTFVESADRVTIDPGSAQVQILDDDIVTFGFAPDSYSDVESVGNVSLGVRFLSGSFGSAPISVQLALNTASGTAQGTPAAEADYESVIDQQITFTEFTRLQQVAVDIVDDDFTENSEMFGATLSNLVVLVDGVEQTLAASEASRIIVQPDTASVEILDNDESVIGFRPTEYSAFENQGAINFTIELISGQLRIDVPFNFSTADIASSINRAEAGVDYTPVPGLELVFNAMVIDASVSVSIIDDGVFELAERFNGLLTSTSLPANVRLDPDLAVGTILEQGAITNSISITASLAYTTTAIVIGWEQELYVTSENSGSVELCASITSQAAIQLDPFSLNVAYSDLSAIEDADYSVPAESLSIGPFSQASRRACVTVNINDDEIVENLESFSAMLESGSNTPDQLTISPGTTRVNIEDNDRITVGWEETSYITNEGDNMVELCAVILSPAMPALIDRDPFTLTPTCPSGSAALNEDYNDCPSTIGPFSGGQPRACINVGIIDDPIPEEPEDFTAILWPSPDPLISLDPSRNVTVVTIVDNDVIELTLDPTPSVTVAESSGSLQVCVLITSPPNSTEIQRPPFTIAISTMDGTATAPADYIGVDIMEFGPFSNTMRRQCVAIPIVLDSVPENDEQFTVTAEENVNGVSIAAPTTTVTIVDSIRRVNDTVIGDPLMTVPVNLINASAIPKLGENAVLNLCYELHGDADATFNLVSDGCVSVNAHYAQIRPTEFQNIIDAVYVRAVDDGGTCRNIAVSLSGCSASVDGVSIDSMYSQMGVYVRPYSNRVRIAVPNCGEVDLVMWVMCQSRTFWSSQLGPDGREITFDADMIRFVIARGLNLQETSHGLLGQFWNIPVSVSAFDTSNPQQELYTVSVQYPGRPMRSFVGMLWPLTWEYREEYCLYTGNGQAGPLDVADAKGGPNDPVIEGEYFRYKVDSNFDTDFEFAHFEETKCG